MFAKVLCFFALVAVAFAAPRPDPQLLSYGYDYVPSPVVASAYSAYPGVVSPYAAAAPITYTNGYAGYPVAGSYYYR